MSQSAFIIAGGASLKPINLRVFTYLNTITINKSALYVPNATYFITMDYTVLRKIPNLFRTSTTQDTTKIFIANYDNDYIKDIKGKITDVRYNLTYELQDFNMIIKSKHSSGLGKTFKDFRSGLNSGYCALQFALIMRFNPIYLLGFDLTTVGRQTHHHGGYGESIGNFKKKLERYYDQFVDLLEEVRYELPEIKIYSCSKVSRLNDLIPYQNINEVLRNER